MRVVILAPLQLSHSSVYFCVLFLYFGVHNPGTEFAQLVLFVEVHVSVHGVLDLARVQHALHHLCRCLLWHKVDLAVQDLGNCASQVALELSFPHVDWLSMSIRGPKLREEPFVQETFVPS